MTIDNKVRNEKLQYDINWDASKILALWWGKIYIYEYLAGEEILPSGLSQIIQQDKFTHSPLGKAFWKRNRKTGWCF